MSLVHLLSTAPQFDPKSGLGSGELGRLLRAVEKDRFKLHRLTPSCDNADLIIFADSERPDLSDIRHHPIFRKYIEKCFVVHYGDKILPFVPGIFTCAEKPWHTRRRSRTGSYTRVMENTFVYPSTTHGDQPFLFSFVGRSETASVRGDILKLSHPDALIIDTSAPDATLSINDYVSLLQRSRFVLCPRGLGSSSLRLFESLKVGRCPVIISDRWIPPAGPDWAKFAVFVKESRVSSIPELLKSIEDTAKERGRLAREAWDEWFSEKVIFHRIVDGCLDIAKNRRLPERLGAPLFSLSRLRPNYIVQKIFTRH